MTHDAHDDDIDWSWDEPEPSAPGTALIVADDPGPIAFTPVPLARRRDGWSPARQRGFIDALAASGSVTLALAEVGMAAASAYRLRQAPGSDSFARAWDMAVARAARRVGDVLLDQAIHGVPEPIVAGGQIVGEKRRFNHRTMMWVLQHHQPDRYPGGSTTHRRGWGGSTDAVVSADGRAAKRAEAQRLREDIRGRLDRLYVHFNEGIVDDPAKRAAHEVLHGPQDWDLTRKRIAWLKSGRQGPNPDEPGRFD